MGKRIELPIGSVWKGWTVIRDSGVKKELSGSIRGYYLCKCVCGKEKEVKSSYLIRNKGYSHCKSCSVRAIRTSHGLTYNSLYWIYKSMMARCYRSSYKNYGNYGGRGIKVCERWRNSVHDFIADMGPRPEGYQIDRIDPDGNYELSNCRWVTRQENLANRRCSPKYKGLYVTILKSKLCKDCVYKNLCMSAEVPRLQT